RRGTAAAAPRGCRSPPRPPHAGRTPRGGRRLGPASARRSVRDESLRLLLLVHAVRTAPPQCTEPRTPGPLTLWPPCEGSREGLRSPPDMPPAAGAARRTAATLTRATPAPSA